MLVWAGCGVLLLAAVWYFWPAIRRSREGFQTQDPTNLGNLQKPSDFKATPETCALMKAVSEQIKAKYQKAVDDSNKLLIDLLKPSVDSVDQEIAKMGC